MPAYFGNRRGLRSGAAGGGEVAADTFLTIFGSDLVVWYDASDAASITHVAGAVSQWNDKSGNADHLTQGTAANQPTYSATGLGGSQPSISFATNDYLASTVSAIATGSVSDFAAFVVARMNSASATGGRIAAFTRTGGDADWNHAGSVHLIGRNAATEAIIAERANSGRGTKAITYDTTFRAASVWSGGNHTMYVENVAGTPVADGSGAIAATGTLRIGVGYDLSAVTAFLTGHVCEFAFVKIAPSAGQLTSVQAMLSAKWTV
jgi:hypothetical protein